MSNFQKVKFYLQELGYDITTEDQADEVFVINAIDDGIQNLVIDCEAPILIIEQFLFTLNTDNEGVFKNLLQKNREIVHGAFALDDTGTKIVFRDTLQLESLDLNELEGSLNSLKLLMAEYSGTLLKFARY